MIPHVDRGVGEVRNAGDHRQEDQRQDQAVFDRRRAPLVIEYREETPHRPISLRCGHVPPDCGGHNPSVVNGLLPGARQLQKKPTMTVVAAALVDGDGRVLLQQRRPGRAMAGLWEFPGGKVESDERAEAALARELEEELGIKVDAAALAPACFASAPLGDCHMILLLYICRSWTGQPRPLDASALRWLRPAEMHGLAMPPADLPLIPMLEKLI